jgi:ribose 5-phosphate isomerase B
VRIALGSDHAGFHLKDLIARHVADAGHDVLDLGTDSTDRVDYPDFGAAVGRAVAEGRADVGLCVCGSGIGIAMAAGKIPGVRAATVHDVTSARLAREHNDANVMCIGQRFVGEQTALDALDAFLGAVFEGGRHAGRVAKIDALDAVPEADPTPHEAVTR